MRKRIANRILLPFFFFVVPFTPLADDWPNFRGPNWNGISTETRWDSAALGRDLRAEPPNIEWVVEVGKGYTSVAVRGRTLYTIGNDRDVDTVYCIDSRSGSVRWEYSYDCRQGNYPGPRATPTIDGDRLYTVSQVGDVFCFDASAGTVIWQRHLVDDFDLRPPAWGFAGSARIDGNLVILNAGKHGIALDKEDGGLVWSGGPGQAAYATPVVFDHDGTRLAAIFAGPGLYVVDVETGDEVAFYRWRTQQGINVADPVIHGDSIFISSAYNVGGALLRFTGNRLVEVWSNQEMHNHFSSCVYLDGYLYGFDHDQNRRYGYLKCLEWDTGRVVWEERLGVGSITVADGKMITLTGSGQIRIVPATPAGYAVLSEAALPRSIYWTAPVLADGRLYVRNLKGDLFCIEM
jgi:outer membrane protein assembly factor BamB